MLVSQKSWLQWTLSASRYVAGAGIPAASAVVLSVTLARVMRREDFGAYFGAQAAVTLVSTAAAQWLAQSAVYHIARKEPESDAVPATVYSAVATALVLCTIGLLVAGTLALSPSAWPQVTPELVVAVALASATTSMSLVALAIRQASMEMALYNRLQLRLHGGRFIAAVVMAWLGFAVEGVLIAGAAVFLVVLAVDSVDVAGDWYRARFGLTHERWMRKHWSYGSPFVFWALSSAVVAVSDRLVVGATLGSGALALYSAAYTVATGVAFVVAAPVILFVHPTVQKMWTDGDLLSARRLLAGVMAFFAAVAVLAFASARVFAEPVLSCLFGASYKAAAPLLPWLTLAGLLWQVCLVCQKPLEVSGRLRVMAAMMVVAAVVNLLLNLLFLRSSGLLFAAFSTIVAYGLYLIGSYYFGWARNASPTIWEKRG